MMPQPVDFQTEAGRLAAVDRIQSIVDRASLAAQQRQVLATEEEQVQHETQVQQTNQSENPEIDADGRRRNPFVGRRRRRAAPQEEEQATSGEGAPRSNGHFDVTV